jgi:hypothetical protein
MRYGTGIKRDAMDWTRSMIRNVDAFVHMARFIGLRAVPQPWNSACVQRRSVCLSFPNATAELALMKCETGEDFSAIRRHIAT